MQGDPRGAESVQSRPPRAFLCALPFLAIVVFLLWETRSQTFYADEWFFFAHAAGFDIGWLARPDQGNLVSGATLVYKLTLSIAGVGGHLGMRLVWIGLILLCSALFFALMRKRVGFIAAYVPAVVLAVFGSAWEMFGGPLGINVLSSLAAGLAALLVLERDGTRADLLGCLLLTFSVVAHSTGLAILAGLISAVLIRPDRYRRIWIVAIPTAVYAAWWIWARKFGGSDITLQTISSTPAASVSLFASAVASMTGTFRFPGPHDPAFPDVVIIVNQDPGLLLGGALAVAVGWRLRQIEIEWRFLPPVVTLLAYWASLALVSPAREPGTGRYQYASTIFILFILAELWRGWRPSRGGVVAILALGVVAIVPNMINLHYAAAFMRQVGIQDKAKLAIVEELRGRFDPETVIQPPPVNIERDLATSATSYFKGVDSFGSPAYEIDELQATEPNARLGADEELAYLLELDVVPAYSSSSGLRCRRLAPETFTSGGGSPAPPGGIAFKLPAKGEAEVGVRRFGDDFYRLRSAAGGGWFHVRLPVDGIPHPWYVAIESATPVPVCPLRPKG